MEIGALQKTYRTDYAGYSASDNQRVNEFYKGLSSASGDVHVKKVEPGNASQLEMFALSCYLDDKGITDGGTFGSFSRMKAYAGNAAYNGKAIDLQNPDNVSAKLDWISMLKEMANTYLQNTKTYSQYLDSSALAYALEKWSDNIDIIPAL